MLAATPDWQIGFIIKKLSTTRRKTMKSHFLKKLVSRLLVTVLVLSSFNAAFASTESNSSKSDIKGHWAEAQISAWIEKGLIKGYGEGSFKPDKEITRAEFIALTNRSMGFSEEAAISFTDVNVIDWAYSEIAAGIKAGYITGYADGTFGSNKAISRQEVAVILDRLLGLSNTQTKAASFKDSSSIEEWAKGSVDAAVNSEILKGYAEDNTFKPMKAMTRAEAVVTLDRVMAAKDKVYNTAGTYGPISGVETIRGDVAINVANVTLRNVIITGNLLFAAGIGDGDATLNNVTVKGQTKIEGGGENSIHINNSIILTIIVDKKNGTVRIVAEGTTTVGEVTVQSPTTIQETGTSGEGFSKITLSELLPAESKVTLKGTFDSLTVKSDKIKIDIPEGSIKEITAESTSTDLELSLGAEAKIFSLILDAVAKILGTGTIDKATLNAAAKAGTSFEKPATKTEDKIETNATPTPLPSKAPTTVTTPTNNDDNNNNNRDTTAPSLSSVTTGTVAVGDNVYATTNENGFLYLYKINGLKTLTELNANEPAFIKKVSATAGVSTALNTSMLYDFNYIVYAVDASGNISNASAAIKVSNGVTGTETVTTQGVSAISGEDGQSTITFTKGWKVGDTLTIDGVKLTGSATVTNATYFAVGIDTAAQIATNVRISANLNTVLSQKYNMTYEGVPGKFKFEQKSGFESVEVLEVTEDHSIYVGTATKIHSVDGSPGVTAGKDSITFTQGWKAGDQIIIDGVTLYATLNSVSTATYFSIANDTASGIRHAVGQAAIPTALGGKYAITEVNNDELVFTQMVGQYSSTQLTVSIQEMASGSASPTNVKTGSDPTPAINEVVTFHIDSGASISGMNIIEIEDRGAHSIWSINISSAQGKTPTEIAAVIAEAAASNPSYPYVVTSNGANVILTAKVGGARTDLIIKIY
jgi:hypothetical protein